MTEEAFKEYLEHRFEGQCDYYSRHAALNRKRYLTVQTITIVACAPLFQTGVEEYASLVAEDERRRLFVSRVEGSLRRESSQWVAAATSKAAGAAPPGSL